MAVLPEATRSRLHQWIMQRISALGSSTSATKSEWRQLIDAADDFVNSNASSYNTSIPAGVRAKFTSDQKALALALVCLSRSGEA